MHLRAVISPLRTGFKEASLTGLGEDLYDRAEALLLRDVMFISSVGDPDEDYTR